MKLIADIRIYNVSDSEKHIELDFRSSSRAAHRVAMNFASSSFRLANLITCISILRRMPPKDP